jgi:hypothetical protein
MSCPPGATMWTFYDTSITHPSLSRDSSKKVTCDTKGLYTIPPGWGLLCNNSICLKLKRNVEAMDRAQRLLEKRLDAVSRPALYRSLNATHRSIEDVANGKTELGTNVFEFTHGHHSVGGSSIRNLTPMLSGLLLADMEAKNKKYQA